MARRLLHVGKAEAEIVEAMRVQFEQLEHGDAVRAPAAPGANAAEDGTQHSAERGGG